MAGIGTVLTSLIINLLDKWYDDDFRS